MAIHDHAAEQPPAEIVPHLVLPTDRLPEQHRLPLSREGLSEVVSVDITPVCAGVPCPATGFVAAGPIGVSLLQGSPSRSVQTRRHLDQSDENFTIGFL